MNKPAEKPLSLRKFSLTRCLCSEYASFICGCKTRMRFWPWLSFVHLGAGRLTYITSFRRRRRIDVHFVYLFCVTALIVQFKGEYCLVSESYNMESARCVWAQH